MNCTRWESTCCSQGKQRMRGRSFVITFQLADDLYARAENISKVSMPFWMQEFLSKASSWTFHINTQNDRRYTRPTKQKSFPPPHYETLSSSNRSALLVGQGGQGGKDGFILPLTWVKDHTSPLFSYAASSTTLYTKKSRCR